MHAVGGVAGDDMHGRSGGPGGHFGNDLPRRAAADQKGAAPLLVGSAERNHVGLEPRAPACGRSSKDGRVQDHQAERRAVGHGRGQRRVVVDAEVTAVPDDLHGYTVQADVRGGL